MLKQSNNYWKFDSEEELHVFLNAAEDSQDDYDLSSFGRSQRGEWYAYGTIVYHTKFGKQQNQQQNQAQQVQTQQNVTTF